MLEAPFIFLITYIHLHLLYLNHQSKIRNFNSPWQCWNMIFVLRMHLILFSINYYISKKREKKEWCQMFTSHLIHVTWNKKKKELNSKSWVQLHTLNESCSTFNFVGSWFAAFIFSEKWNERKKSVSVDFWSPEQTSNDFMQANTYLRLYYNEL